MPIAKRHHTDTHQFYGEAFGVPVAEYLNSRTKGGPRIFALLIQLVELDKGRDLQSYKEINRKLARYKTSPMLWPDQRKDTWQRLLGGASIPFSVAHVPASKRKAHVLETEAASNLIRLAEMGLLRSLRPCENKHQSDGQWFFGRFAHQRFCSSKCRIHYNANSEVARRQRREWMRKNYKYKMILESRKGA